jgi:hypothetical protein
MMRTTLKTLTLLTLLAGAAPAALAASHAAPTATPNATPNATRRATRVATADTTSKDTVTTVAVRNDAFSDAQVWVMRDGFRYRLGTAMGNRTTTFTLPAYLSHGTSTVRFVVRQIGARRAEASWPVTVVPGDDLELTIPAWR